jgi:exodeoxyribonuclease VIII
MSLTEGIHEKIAPNIYRADTAVSRSDLLLMSPPARYKWEKAATKEEASTKALDFGQAFHTMMIEPELFDTRHVLSTYPDFRSKEAREWRDTVTAQGKTIITKDDRERLLGMGASARAHSSYRQIMSGARHEVTAVGRHAGTGLMLKARPDVVPIGNALVDFKSARDASPAGFGKAVWDFKYFQQAPHYLDVWNDATTKDERKREEFLFFVVESEAPYLCSVYVTPHELIEYGRKLNNAALYTLAHCLKTNSWPGYPQEIDEFELPGWAKKELEGAMAI